MDYSQNAETIWEATPTLTRNDTGNKRQIEKNSEY